MPECDYCTTKLETEDELIQHFVDEHKNELSRIDKRRVQQHETIDLNPELTMKGMLVQTVILLTVAGIISAIIYLFMI